MIDNSSELATLENALQLVRLLKDRSGEGIAWERVERVLLADDASSESSAAVDLDIQSQAELLSAERESCCCSRNASGGESVVRYDDDRLQKALLYIHMHLDESFGVEGIAKDICVSRRWLEYAFRAAFGITPFQYLRCVRLELARLRLMNEPKCKVQQIASDSGFTSARQFTMTFRQYFGYSPSVCRGQSVGVFSQSFSSLAEAC